METKDLTETEILVRLNTIKDRHELLKKEILEHLDSVELKEKELMSIEEEYVGLMAKLTL